MPSNDKVRHPSNNSASGLEVKRCISCSASERDTKTVIRNGLSLIRIRYGLPYSELPDLSPSQLGRYHLFLLEQGKVRTSVPFPRRQRFEENGLCYLQRLRRHERWELALSVASIKRNLPSSCSRHTPSARPAWEASVLSQPPPLPDEYLAFCKAEVSRIFPSNWDRNYERHVIDHVPNASAREGKKSRADHLWMGRREEFLRACLEEAEEPRSFSARYKEVTSSGKCRPLTIFHELIDVLGPLHKVVFEHLEKNTDWLLTGPPTENRITSVCRGEYQTSVDLVSASDGLYHTAADTILDALFFTSVKIPRSIRSLAKASLRPSFDKLDGGRGIVRHGQMMGAYLCFPLLCLQSYCAARWAGRFDKHATYLVNGDDTVISATRKVLAEEYPPGFRLNDTKTARAKNVVELNSTVFLRRGGRWREVRHLRRGGALPTYSGMLHMATACVNAGPRWTTAFTRSRIGRRWGFLPSQLAHYCYPSYRRERTMLQRRTYSDLPKSPSLLDHRLIHVQGRVASRREKDILLDFLWLNGRGGGLKRDVYDPTPGHIRRTYQYRSKPAWRYLSFAFWGPSGKFLPVKKRVDSYFLPEECLTDEEEEGLFVLDLWRQAIGSLVKE